MIRAAAAAVVIALTAPGCGATGDDLSGRVVFDGAPDLAAWSESAGELFAAEHPGVRLRVDRSGEATALRRLCAGEVDAVLAARRPRPREAAACAAAGHEPVDVRVATDGLAVIAHPADRQTRCLSVAEIRRLAAGPFPAVGADVARAYARVSGARAAERDELFPPAEAEIVEQVRRRPGALGFVGVGAAAEHAGTVRRVAIAERGGCVTPSPANVRAGRYRALARPVVLVVRRDGLRRPELQAFLRFAAAEQRAISGAAGLVGLTLDEARAAAERAGRAGRPFT